MIPIDKTTDQAKRVSLGIEFIQYGGLSNGVMKANAPETHIAHKLEYKTPFLLLKSRKSAINKK